MGVEGFVNRSLKQGLGFRVRTRALNSNKQYIYSGSGGAAIAHTPRYAAHDTGAELSRTHCLARTLELAEFVTARARSARSEDVTLMIQELSCHELIALLALTNLLSS